MYLSLLGFFTCWNPLSFLFERGKPYDYGLFKVSNSILMFNTDLVYIRPCNKGRRQNSLSVTINKPQRMTNVGD